MKLAHLSDIHYCDKHLEEVDRCMEAVLAYLSCTPVDAIVLSGDTFDHRLEQNSPALLAAIKRVRDLTYFAPVLILQGTLSHDVPHAIEVFTHINGPHRIFIADHIGQVVLTPNGERSPNWCLLGAGNMPLERDLALFSCLPAVNKGNVAAAVGAENAAHEVGEQVANLLQSWAPSHREARAKGIPTIVVSHGTVSGSLTEHGVPMAGLDHEFTAGALGASEANAVMLGHIHKHQAWQTPNGALIAYPGSLGRLHFGEHDAKGFLLWDLNSDSAGCEFIETPAKALIDIDFPGPPDMVELARIAATAPAHAHVRIRYSIDEEHRASVDKDAMTALFAHCAEVKIEGRIAPVQRQRAAGIGQAPSLASKLEQWCDLTQVDKPPLLERLAHIQSLAPDAIVEQFS